VGLISPYQSSNLIYLIGDGNAEVTLPAVESLPVNIKTFLKDDYVEDSTDDSQYV